MSTPSVFARHLTSLPAGIGAVLLVFGLILAATPAYALGIGAGFVAAGTGLLLTLRPSVRAHQAQFALGLALTLLALGTFFGVWEGLGAHLDLGRPRPFTPNVDAALAFLAAGGAFVLLSRSESTVCRTLVGLFALATLGVGAFDLVGRLFRFDAVLGWYAQLRMPLAAAIAAILLGVALWLRANVRISTARMPGHDVRIIVTSVAVMVIIVMIAAALGFVMLARQTEQLLRESLAISLQARSTLFAHGVEETMEASAVLLRSPDFRVLTRPRRVQAMLDSGVERPTLRKLRTALGASAIGIYDATGRRLASGGNETAKPTFRHRLPGGDGYELLWRDGVVLRATVPVRAADGRMLALSLDFPAPRLMPVVLDVPDMGATGALFVCMERGLSVTCLPSRATPAPVTVPWFQRGKALPIHHALIGETGVMRSRDYLGHEVIAAYAPVGDLRLGMVLKMDRDELNQPIHRQFERALAVLLVLIVAGVLLMRREVAPLIRELLSEIEERRRAEGELRKLSAAVEQSASMVLIADRDGVIEYVNPKVTQVTGYEAHELIGKTPRVLQSGNTSSDQYEALWAALTSGKEWRGEFQNRKKSGELYWVFESISPIRNADGVITHYLSVEEDVTARKEVEQRLSHLAHFDGLTGLPNRELFHERLHQAMTEAAARRRMVGLLFLDLDRFKNINDTLGHAAGDALLIAVSERLTACLRRGDTIARLGGDEFTIVLADLAQGEDAGAMARKILDVLHQPFSVHDRELYISASIGITLYPSDSDDVDTLITNADVAMYRAKARGRNTYQFYTAEMNAKAMEQLALENALRRALEREEFELHYQPQIDLRTGAVVGAEALIRWRHHEWGMIPPAQFIPLAEDTGLISAIGQWVVRRACAQVRAWRQAGLPRMRVTINLSARQFATDNLPGLIEDALVESGVESDDLGIELTEGLLMENAPAAVAALESLGRMGLELAIDDFGMGYSSLSYLRRFRIDVLKIDQSFIRDLQNPDGASIVNAIILLAHGLGLRVIAEGVETAEELAHLRGRGCDAAQGYYYSRALPPAEFAAFLRGHDARVSVAP